MKDCDPLAGLGSFFLKTCVLRLDPAEPFGQFR
jgi:hypothetical protein